MLRRANATGLVVVGMETDYCVLATVLAGLDEGLRTVVVTDAVNARWAGASLRSAACGPASANIKRLSRHIVTH